MYKDIIAISIDDNEQNLMLLEAYADQMELQLKSFLDPVEALEFINSQGANYCDIVFVDYMMPKLNGVDFIKKFRLNNPTSPIVMITAVGDNSQLKCDALEAGATDFLSKPLDLTEFTLRAKNLLSLRIAQIKLQEKVTKANQDLIEREHESLVILGKTAEWKDPETASHVARVAHYSKLLAKQLELDEEIQEIIYFASPFHDIGKVGIADDILLKPGKLDDEQFVKMKEHSNIGYEILKNSKSKYLQMGAEIAISHHEKWDGSGYPNAIKGIDIPISGRIVAIADVFDALTSIRPYKRAWGFDEAIEFLKEQKAKHFDPDLVDIFVSNIEDVKKIYNEFKE